MRSITNRLLSVLEGLENDIKDVTDDYTREQLEAHTSDLKGIESDIYTGNHDGISKFKRHIEATGNYDDVEIIHYSKENDVYTLIQYHDLTATKEQYSYIEENNSFMLVNSTSYYDGN